MPLYEYLCDNCHTKFEIRRTMRESDSPAACPECQSDRVERQISLVFAMRSEGGSMPVSSGGCGCGGACGCGGHRG